MRGWNLGEINSNLDIVEVLSIQFVVVFEVNESWYVVFDKWVWMVL